ncbi:MAG TPA: FAD-binding oxidoreductase [Armatimonadota bacterium]|jgi:phenol hydroxylase P5 protein
MGEAMQLRVQCLELIAPEVYRLDVGPVEPPLAWKPGQWASLRLPVGPHPPLVRAYSLASPPDGTGIMPLIFDHVDGGLGSTYLKELGPGDEVEMGGVLGKFVLPEPLVGGILFGARFTGAVPVRCIVRALAQTENPPRVRLVQGARTRDGLLFLDEFAALDRYAPWFSYHPILLEPEEGWNGPVGEELDLLRPLSAEEAPYVPMLSGVREFTVPARAFFQEERGFDRRAVRVEHYD